MAAALMLSFSFSSCDELEGLFDDEKESSADGAFFPVTYSQRTVAAWYSLTEKKDNSTRVEAVFLFEDGSFVTTKCKTYTDGRSQERKILAEGEFRLTGDYDNGTVEVMINGVPEPMTVEIKDGKMQAMDETFTKQSNKKVPKATTETGDSDDNQGGDNNQGQGGDNNQGNGVEAFFPTGFSGQNVAAWYSSTGEIKEQGYEIKYNASIYFFENGTFVAAANNVVSGPNGPVENKTVAIKGRYSIKEGDFNTGKIELTGEDGKSVTIGLEQGKLTYVEADGQVTVYLKQDNAKVPQPSEPTDNGSQGGENNPQGGENQNPSGVPAFFPKAYADKTVVAWYSYEESISVQTLVQAVFLFSDGTLVVTENKVFAQEVQENPERYIMATGSYTLEGKSNYENGQATVILVPERKVSAYINDGKLTIEISTFTFTKRDNKDVPQPLDPTDQGQQGGDDNPQGGDDNPQGGDDNPQGGDDNPQGGEDTPGGEEGGDDEGDGFDDSLLKAYLPADYANFEIAACYMFSSDEENSTKRVESVFLFTDGTLIVTKTKIYSKSDGRRPEYKVVNKGHYEFAGERDYENGTASVVTADGMTMEVAIEEGIMTVMETTFVKIPNELIPYMTTNGK